MRVLLAAQNGGPAAAQFVQEYADLLLGLGNGTEQTYPELGGPHCIAVPDAMLLPPNENGDPAELPELINFVYHDMPAGPLDTGAQQLERARYYQDKAMLSPKNVTVDDINDKIVSTLPGEEVVRLSADSVADATAEDTALYPTEFLNTLQLSGVPEHKLTLKVGAVVILLRTLSIRQGMCNGTRVLVTGISRLLIKGIIISGTKFGDNVGINRLTIEPSDGGLPFVLRRQQFPIKVAFAMTINKAQGQSLRRVGLFLPQPCFSHGQLYVAASRSGFPPSGDNGVRIVVRDVSGVQGTFRAGSGVYTRNVVYHDAIALLGIGTGNGSSGSGGRGRGRGGRDSGGRGSSYIWLPHAD